MSFVENWFCENYTLLRGRKWTAARTLHIHCLICVDP